MKFSAEKTLGKLKEEFSLDFPGLKIEFYSKKHVDHEGSAEQFKLEDHLKLSALDRFKEAELEVSPQLSVSEFEESVNIQCGLNVQVFRRSADLWLQTTATDSWTLEVQNRKGVHSIEAGRS